MRSVKHMPRPNDLSEETKKRIQRLFEERALNNVEVDFRDETIDVLVTKEMLDKGFISIPMETLGKMIGLINYAGATVRKK